MKAEPDNIDFSLGEDDFLIPFGFTEMRGAEKITCLPGYESELLKFGTPEDDIDLITGFFTSEGKKHGYETEIAETLIFTCDGGSVNGDAVLDSSEALRDLETYVSLVEFDVSEDEGSCICATVLDGTIVSAAWINPFSDARDGDIAVETAEGFENRGFAASNVALLCKMILRENGRATYIARTDNRASVRVAEKAGLARCGKEFRVLWFK
ncbi:MAG: hypothetical protein J5563_07545 [Clostridia bacterium]|nr:hypothetical protein [Clostridia bacterium]